MTIRTTLLDARLIHGEASLFQEMRARFLSSVVQGSRREFIAAKLAEREERLRRAGASRYRVEPNIKEGKGGMRDLNMLHWLAAYLQPGKNGAGRVQGVRAARDRPLPSLRSLSLDDPLPPSLP